MENKRKIKLLLLVMVVLLATACSGGMYKTLVLSQHTYDTTLTSMGELYKEGVITDAQKDEAIKLGRTYMTAHNDAVDVLVAYEEAGGQGSQEAIKAAVDKASAALADLIAFYRRAKGGS